MSVAAVKWARALKLDRSSKAVLLDLAERANKDSQCWPSHQGIADALSITTRTVERAIKRLAEAGVLKPEYRYDKRGKRTSNCYTLEVGKEAVTTRQPVGKSEIHYPTGCRSLPDNKDVTTRQPVGDHYIELQENVHKNTRKKESSPHYVRGCSIPAGRNLPPAEKQNLAAQLQAADDPQEHVERRFWTAVDVLEAAGVPRALCGRLLKAIQDFAEGLAVLRNVAAARDPMTYLAKVCRNRELEAKREAAAFNGGPSDEPEVVREGRRDGLYVCRDGPNWRVGGFIYNASGEEIGW